MKLAVDQWREPLAHGDKLREFALVKTKFYRIKYEKMLKQWWSNYRNRGPSREEIMRKIRDHVLQQFINALRRGPIHGVDLKTRGIDKARELYGEKYDEKKFQASDSWVLAFKRRYKIVSRKITRFVAKSQKNPDEQAEQTATAFVDVHRSLLTRYGHLHAYNADE